MSVYQDYYLSPEDYKAAERNGIYKELLNVRFYHNNWSKERAINQPKRKHVQNCKYRKRAKDNGININTYTSRVQRGWSKKDASTITPLSEKERTRRVCKARRKYPDWVYDTLKEYDINIITFHERIRMVGKDMRRE